MYKKQKWYLDSNIIESKKKYLKVIYYEFVRYKLVLKYIVQQWKSNKNKIK